MIELEAKRWYSIRLKLLVTGDTERENISIVFKPLLTCGFIRFDEPLKIEQLSPRKSHLLVTGTTKRVMPKRDEQLGGIARNYFMSSGEGEVRLLIVLDDVEHDRIGTITEVFERYRCALDAFLCPIQKEAHASVHFLRNMLEAYYFADTNALSEAMKVVHPDLKASPEVYEGDVEYIRHPKNDLKRMYGSFDEIRDGKAVLERIEWNRVLSKPQYCTSLRTMFNWCIRYMKNHPGYNEWSDTTGFPALTESELWPVTMGQ